MDVRAQLAAEEVRRAALRAILAAPEGIAYEAGWTASRTSTTYDLDAAERRFERRYGEGFGGTMFAAGWTDQATDKPKFTALTPAQSPATLSERSRAREVRPMVVGGVAR